MSAELFAAARSGNTARVRELLTVDPAVVSDRDSEGATALHYATLNGYREIVELLLNSGADINARDDRFDATPTGWAIEYLRDRGGLLAIEIEDLLYAIRENDVRWVRRLLTRLPALSKATDAQGKAVSEHAAESVTAEIDRMFKVERGLG